MAGVYCALMFHLVFVRLFYASRGYLDALFFWDESCVYFVHSLILSMPWVFAQSSVKSELQHYFLLTSMFLYFQTISLKIPSWSTLLWNKERAVLNFEGGGHFQNKFKLSLVNFHEMNYLGNIIHFLQLSHVVYHAQFLVKNLNQNLQ